MKRTVMTAAGRMTYDLIRTVHIEARAVALPGGQVRVYAPAGLSLRQADELVRTQASALHERIKMLDAPQKKSGCLPIEGVFHPVRITQGAQNAVVADGEVHIALPEPTDRAALHTALEALLHDLARERIMQRLAHWHKRIGGEYAGVTVCDLGIKWGACSQEKALSFSPKLILAQPEALDYVVIHELCHLHEFSHSARFWNFVRAQMADYECWKGWLQTHKQELMHSIEDLHA